MDSYTGGKSGKRGKGKSSHPHFWKGGGGHGGRFQLREDFQGEHVLDAESAMQSITKVLPAWDPRLEKRGYAFRIRMLDVAMCRIGAEILENRQGAAVAQRLGGVVKVLAKHIPPANLRDGADIKGQHFDDLGVLLRGLTRRSGGFQEETAHHAIAELLSFRRVGNESVDDALGRFETLHSTSTEAAGFDMGHGALSWMLLTAMEIPRPAWPLLLAPTGGTFPVNGGGFANLMLAIRRQGHIAEHTHAGPTTLDEGHRRPGGTGNYFWDGNDFGQDRPSSFSLAAMLLLLLMLPFRTDIGSTEVLHRTMVVGLALVDGSPAMLLSPSTTLMMVVSRFARLANGIGMTTTTTGTTPTQRTSLTRA